MRKLELDVQLKEFEVLRNEILLRLRIQHQVILFTVMVLAAAISLFPLILQHQMYALLLLFGALFFIFGWHYFEQDFLITHIARYIQQSLKEQMRTIVVGQGVKDALLLWEEFRNKIVFQSRRGRIFYTALTFFRLVPTVGSGFLAMAAFVYFRSINQATASAWSAAAICLFVIDCLLGVSMIIVGFIAYTNYTRIVVRARTDTAAPNNE